MINLNRHLSLFELVVVITLISIVAVELFSRLQAYREIAEKSAKKQTVVMLRTALNFKMAAYIAKGRFQELGRLENDNPMNWLSRHPTNYVGEYFNPQPGDIPDGKWYFDLAKRELVYLIDQGTLFVTYSDDKKQVRYQVVLIWKDLEEPETTHRELAGIVLRTVKAYTKHDI